MAEKVTRMVLKTDLQCPCCYKKVKQLLCKFPQIRDQVYDEKKNLVTITVVCCSPEKIRDKLCCMGGKVIHSIDILQPHKLKPPPPADKPNPPPPADKPKSPPPADKPVVLPPPQPPAPCPGPAASYPVPVGYCGTPCYCNYGPCPCPCCNGYGRPPACPCRCCNGYGRPACPCRCCNGYGRPPACPCPCCNGYGRPPACPCPCCNGYGRPALPPPCCDDNCGGYGYGYNKGCHVSRCDYFSEENSSGCTIM